MKTQYQLYQEDQARKNKEMGEHYAREDQRQREGMNRYYAQQAEALKQHSQHRARVGV